MNHAAVHAQPQPGYVLHFRSLFDDGRGFAFPCNERGEVDVAALSPRARANYRAVQHAIGRDFGMPAVERPAWH
ncbi:MAG TPA: hypothetical protein VLE94_13910 [Burkholderiaceae bacterium]|nr:hypothetical protein [Burkholderiaceae bacterium]